MSKSTPGPEPQSLEVETEINACAPSWLKVEPSPERNVNVASSFPYNPTTAVESSAGIRPTRRLSLDVASVPPPIISSALADLVSDTIADRQHVVDSSAAAQRRLRQATFVHSQVLKRY
jgi:hypothetical protein